MSFRTHRGVLVAAIGAMFVGCCGAGGCNNDNFANHGIITAATRFQLAIQTEPIPDRLLLDSLTGDLWHLDTTPGGEVRWVRLASGPTDIRVMTPQEILGVRSAATPAP